MIERIKRAWCFLAHWNDICWKPIHHSWHYRCDLCGREGIVDDL